MYTTEYTQAAHKGKFHAQVVQTGGIDIRTGVLIYSTGGTGKVFGERVLAMRLHSPGIPIRVQADPAGRPEAFTLGGRIYRVDSLEERREPRLDWWSPLGEAHRAYWLVSTGRGLICELCQDRGDGSWRLVRELD